LAAGTYKATGTDKDAYGDTGTWSFTLTVSATAITQIAPTKARTTTGEAFTGQLKVSGSHGTVTYAQSIGAPDLKVSSSGAVSAPATLAAGTYKGAGTARDSLGDTGTWSFTLTVKANKLTQIAPTKARTTTGEAFTGQLKVSGSHGTVTYAQSIGAPDLKVSSSGAVSARPPWRQGPTRERALRETASVIPDLELHLDRQGQQAHPNRTDQGEDHDRRSLHRPAQGLGIAWNGHLRPSRSARLI